jgi:Ca2+-transporting ATPase
MKNTYYNKKVNEVFKEMNSGEHGLSKKEVKKRVLKYGLNKLPEIKPDSALKIFFRQFQSPLIFILLIATAIVFLMDELTEGLVILAVLLFNAIIGTIQEGKSQKIFIALKNFTKTNASVIREGQEHVISDEEVVLGDVIMVREGEKIPADARIIESKSLQIDETAFTGESSPKFKTSALLEKTKKDKEIAIADQNNMIFKGTSVISGHGKALVVKTGSNTFIGGIASKITKIKEDLPIKKDIKKLSRFIIVMVSSASVVMFAIGFFQGQNLREIFLTVVALAVSIVPEGLPIVVTLVLASGVWRMGKQNVLIKKLQAVEALGQIDVIAVDKTGTVTKNQLTVKKVYTEGKTFLIKGVGYEPKGEIRFKGKITEPLNHSELLKVGKIGILCSDANLFFDNKKENWKISGDPTEAATLVLGEKLGFNKSDLEQESKRIDEKAFDYKLKYHATLNKEDKDSVLSVIGAPEEILNLSSKIWTANKSKTLTKQKRENLEKVLLKMSARGFRVIALATRNLKHSNKIPEKIHKLEFVGFLGIEDSLKIEVFEAVNKVNLIGIKTVMITGDHKITAKAIAKEAGIFKRGDVVLEGFEIEEMTENKLATKLAKTSVFARVTPLHKLKIINAYKISGKTIAMTGDGVNDALSLTSADVGVAMGRVGTEVAKEASDIVVLDDNIGSIVSGIEEGKNIFKTIKRVILYLFSTSAGEFLTIVGAAMLALPLPILATQILWLNLVTDGFLDIALAMEPKRGELKKREIKKEQLVDKLMLSRIVTMSIPMAIGTLILFVQNYQMNLVKAWTFSLTTLAVFQWFNAWNCRSREKSIFQLNPFSNIFLIGATFLVIFLQLLLVYSPVLQNIFNTTALNLKDWILIITIGSSIIVVEEVRKFFYRRNKN